MSQSNSVPLDTPYKRILRFLLSNIFNVRNTNVIVDYIENNFEHLSVDEVRQLIHLSSVQYKLRTVPLVLAIIALKHNKLENPKEVFLQLLTQPNLLTTALSIYEQVNGNVKPLAASLKKALAEKIVTFNDYSLIKGNVTINNFKLSDVIKLTHPKAISKDQEILFKQILDGDTPKLDNWETVISSAKTQQERQVQWERLLLDGKLVNLNLLRNLNNLVDYSVNPNFVLDKLSNINLDKVNLFQLLNATLNIKNKVILDGLNTLINTQSKISLDGRTLIILDISGSMSAAIDHNKTRLQVATMLAFYLGRICENSLVVFTAGDDGASIGKHKIYTKDVKNVSYTKFFEDTCATNSEIGTGGIFTRQCLEWCEDNTPGRFNRTVVISDSCDCDRYNKVSRPFTAYSFLLNIANTSNEMVTDSNWSSEINGWSENLPLFIKEFESNF